MNLRRRKAIWRLFIVLDLLVIVVSGGLWLSRARRWANVIREDVAALQALAAEGPAAVAPWRPDELLQNTHTDLRGVRAEFPFALGLAPHLRWLPRYGETIAAAPHLLQMGLDLTQAGALALEAFDPVLENEGHGMGEATAAALEASQPQLAQAHELLARVTRSRQEIDVTRLVPHVARWVERLDEALPLLSDGMQSARLLPTLLGVSEKRTYLVLIQNEDELRPTGGFITAVAQITVQEGRVIRVAFENSGQVDDFSLPYPDPPLPLREIMDLDLWGFRDANWSPDFPTAAQVALALYRPPYYVGEIDGVLALNQRGAEQLIAAFPPLVVEGYDAPITQANLIAAMRASRAQYEVDPRSQWDRAHKDFLARVLAAAIETMQTSPEKIDPLELGLATLRVLEERDLFIYLLDDDQAAEILRQTGWDGALYQGPGDYLMAVDANLGYNKVNPYIEESLSYTVDLRLPRHPKATLALHYQHLGPQQEGYCYHFEKPRNYTYDHRMEQCHWNYARAYVPEGSRLLSATTHPVPGRMLASGKSRAGEPEIIPQESGKTVFGTFFVLHPGRRHEARFTYSLPSEVMAQVDSDDDVWHYRLYIQRQGGKEPTSAQITVLLPRQARVLESSPPPTQINAGQVTYELQLRTDVVLELRFRATGANR